MEPIWRRSGACCWPLYAGRHLERRRTTPDYRSTIIPLIGQTSRSVPARLVSSDAGQWACGSVIARRRAAPSTLRWFTLPLQTWEQVRLEWSGNACVTIGGLAAGS